MEKYSFLVTVIATLFAMFSLALTYIGYCKFKHVDKVVEKKLKKSLDDFIDCLQDELISIQSANSKIQASYKCFESQDYDSAIELLVEAEEIYPKTYNLFNTLGYAYWKKNDTNTAKMMFKKAIVLHPKSIQGYNDMANLYKTLDDNKNYKHYYSLALKNVPNAIEKWQDL